MKPIETYDSIALVKVDRKGNTYSFSQPNSSKIIIYKRLFDLFISSLVIVFLLSWILPILALIIKLDSRGPVFFTQTRLGKNGKAFKCLKLRSMYVNDQANCQQARTNDSRITRIGHFLRNSCLDELPQFFNVFIGQMSIVGPRPHMLKDCEDFASLVKNYNLRHLVKPGITGMAQVKGYRGETKDFFDVAHRYKWDIFYVKNSSLILDIKIVQQTYTQTIATILNKSAKPELSKHHVPAPNTEIREIYSGQFIEA